MRRPFRDFFNDSPTRVTLEYTIKERDREQFTTHDAVDVYMHSRLDDITGPTSRENITVKNIDDSDDESFSIVEQIKVTERFTEEYLENIKQYISNELSVPEQAITYEIAIVTESS